MKSKPYWIKERHNPHVGVYYVACGQMSKTQAKCHESTIYGANVMLSFDTKEAYDKKLSELKALGEKVL